VRGWEIYRYRWTIEVFFRFFKHVLGCRHLLSHDPVGIEIQTYCAIIACMLISLWTGRKPTLRTYEMICHYFTGLAEEDELLAHLAKLQKQDASAWRAVPSSSRPRRRLRLRGSRLLTLCHSAPSHLLASLPSPHQGLLGTAPPRCNNRAEQDWF